MLESDCDIYVSMWYGKSRNAVGIYFRKALSWFNSILIMSLTMMTSSNIKHFPRYWPFVREIHRSPVKSPRKGQWRGALMFSLICVWINGWVNNREAGDWRRNRVHYDVTVMRIGACRLAAFARARIPVPCQVVMFLQLVCRKCSQLMSRNITFTESASQLIIKLRKIIPKL